MTSNQTADRVSESDALFLTKFESPKLVELIIGKQTQYYTL
jgi:hypothetical protein